MKTTEVKSRPPVPGIGAIPDEVIQELGAKGMHVFLASANANVVAQRSVDGAYPLVEEELADDVTRAARMMGFRVEADGTLKRGDCILYAQPLQQRDYLRDQAEKMWAMQSSAETVYEQVEEMNDRIRRSGQPTGEVVPRSVTDASGHVSKPGIFDRMAEKLTKEE